MGKGKSSTKITSGEAPFGRKVAKSGLEKSAANIEVIRGPDGEAEGLKVTPCSSKGGVPYVFPLTVWDPFPLNLPSKTVGTIDFPIFPDDPLVLRIAIPLGPGEYTLKTFLRV
jgi:hypothetical protein